MRFGEKLVSLRKSRGYTQENLAEMLGVSRQAVARWEANDTAPDITMLLGICEIFHVSADYMIHNDYESDEDIPAVKEKSCEVKEVTQKSKQLHLIAAICLAFGAFFSIIGMVICLIEDPSPSPAQIILSSFSVGLCSVTSAFQFALYFKKK